MTIGMPIRAEATADVKMPLAATTLAFCVSSEIWPLASKPTRTPAVTKYESIQFQTGGAPVSFKVCVNTYLADWNPYVLETAIGSQMMFRVKSSRMSATETLKINL